MGYPIDRIRIACGALLLLVAVSACASGAATPGQEAAPVERPLVVERAVLTPKLLLSGELEAVESERIYVPRTSQWQMPIRWMEEDGAEVEEGQKVLELDNAQFTGDLEQKKLTESSAYNDLMRKKADVAGERFDKEFAREQKRIELEKAQLNAAVPASLRPRREHQEFQLALSKAELEYQKAVEDLATTERAAEAEIEELRIALERARDEIEVAEQAIDALSLTAPRAGLLIVAENPGEGRKFQVGDNAWVGLPVMSIPDLGAMQVVARLSDVDDGRIAVGDEATCTIDAYPEASFRGRVTEIAPIAKEENDQSLRRSFRVVVVLDEADPVRMRPGMSVRVEVRAAELAEALVAPRVALDLAATPPRALLADGSQVEVTLGRCTVDACVVESGLGEGTRLRMAG
jgi:hypothetical protein